MDLNNLVEKVEQWSVSHNIHVSKPEKQFLKVSEEFGEIAAALARGDEEEFVDAIGDTVVTLVILAQQKGYTLGHCLESAYNVIAEREGETIDGVFVKKEDLK